MHATLDPTNGNRILVGTEAAGIIASLDGGLTWTKLFQSEQVPTVTSFVFDEVQKTVLASSYGRGLWKLAFVPRDTTLTDTGDTAADFHDTAMFAIVLTDPSTSPPEVIPGGTINFTLGSQGCTATTGGEVRATRRTGRAARQGRDRRRLLHV